ncbi:MAG: hypothetical protein JNL97_13550 [Verrucomicrobiales bacterium]|nr:hypothetical protein [Verrucomicrobiales bacterium]
MNIRDFFRHVSSGFPVPQPPIDASGSRGGGPRRLRDSDGRASARWSSRLHSAWFGIVVACALGAAVQGRGAEPPDRSLEGPGGDVLASGSCTGKVSAAYRDRWLNVVWEAEGDGCSVASPGATARVVASTDAPGHWAVRDWRSWPMSRTSGGWEARLPLASASVPVVYFVESVASGATNASGMRCFRPTLAKVEEPTFPFSGHLEGFEQGMVGWEWGGSGDGTEWMRLVPEAWTGKAALRIEVPRVRASATVGTLKLRGWMLFELSARKLAFVARTEQGEGRLRLALHGDARTERLAVFPAKEEFVVGPTWRRIEVPMDAFVHLRPRAVDWMTIQFVADSGRAVLVDDLELELR